MVADDPEESWIVQCDAAHNGELLLWNHLCAQNNGERLVVVDVGSRVDDYYFASAPENVEFHLFEPNPLFYVSLAAKATSSLIKKSVRTNNVALGAENGTLPYYERSQSFVCRPVCGDVPGEPSMHLPVRTLRAYMREHGLAAVDFLKIDTEGFEIDVLRGLGDALPRVKHIQFEYGGTYRDRGVLLRDVYETIAAAGGGAYRFFIIRPDGLHERPHPVEHGQYSNYLASREPGELPVAEDASQF